MKRRMPWIFLFFAGFLTLMNGGRIGSGDALPQIQATILLVQTGRLGTADPPGWDFMWVKGIHGLFYPASDIGNVILMLPAAFLEALTMHGPPARRLESPAIHVRFAISLTMSILAAVGAASLARSFSRCFPRTTAFKIAFFFILTTIYLPYSKTAWDVLGACVGVCFLIDASTSILTGEGPVSLRSAAILGASLAIACWFRYSLGPFLTLGVVLVLLSVGKRAGIPQIAAAGLSATVLSIPSFLYNYVRMGNPLKPATMAHQFDFQNSLHGNLFFGLYRELLSPNYGLIFYSPIFLLGLALPFYWGSMPPILKRLSIALLPAALAYVLLIAKRTNEVPFGWGPRYLLPILPIAFLPIAGILPELWKKHRWSVGGLIVVSAVLNLAPTLTNWSLAVAMARGSSESGRSSINVPEDQIAVWTGLIRGIEGKPLPRPEKYRNDDVRAAGARFPDLWLVRLAERSRTGLIASIICLAGLGTLCFVGYRGASGRTPVPGR